MVHGFTFSRLVFFPTLVFAYSNASDFHNLEYQGLVFQVCTSRCAIHTQSNWQWRDLFQIMRSRENHKKGLKDIYIDV